MGFGRGGAPRAARPHPFACPAAELAEVLAGLSWPGTDAVRKAVDDELTLQLPSAGRAPLASPELNQLSPASATPVRPGPVGRVALASWRVPVLAFDPGAALELLDEFSHLDEPAAAAGGSLPYLATVARFAADLAARGQVLPVLVVEGAAYAARWRPVLGGADGQRGRALAAAMPPSCRACEARPAGLAGLAGRAGPARRTGRRTASYPARCWRARFPRSPMPRRAPACPLRC